MRSVSMSGWGGLDRPIRPARLRRAVPALVAVLALLAGCGPFGAADVADPSDTLDGDDLAMALAEAGWKQAACDPIGVPDDMAAPIVSVTVTPDDVIVSPSRVRAGNVTFLATNESSAPVAVSIDRIVRGGKADPAHDRVGELQRFGADDGNLCTFTLASGPHDVRADGSTRGRSARLRVRPTGDGTGS